MMSVIIILSLVSFVRGDSLSLEPGQCWGYEPGCDLEKSVSAPVCDDGVKPWKGDNDPRETFHRQADFGFLKEKRRTLASFCKPESKSGSELRCSENMEFCTGKNMVLDFRDLKERVNQENLKYKMDLFKPGQIMLRRCSLDVDKLKSNLDYMNPLQSWAPELQHVQVDNAKTQCDVTIDKPVLIMKLDASVNMYHHFCDFFNLYLSLHLNSSLIKDDLSSSWNTDNQVLILENYPTTMKSPFAISWSAFTRNPVLNLDDVAGKTVCVKNAVFPMLARMIFGLYYNTPVIEGCQGSELFRRFSKFMLERLEISQDDSKVRVNHIANKRLRVTLISRDTRYRRIINEASLVSALEDTGLFTVTLAKYKPGFEFRDQLQLTHNTDILVGIHGAGLTHLLFLPDWAQVLELYNCDDAGCYKDLARLRGVGYTTHDWRGGALFTSHPVPGGYQGPAHRKFANYEFDPGELVRIMKEIRVKVLDHPLFIKARTHDEL